MTAGTVRLGVVTGAVASWPVVAHAHTGGGAFILLLPTHLYVAGGALVVVVSFVLATLAPTRAFARPQSLSTPCAPPPTPSRAAGISWGLATSGW